MTVSTVSLSILQNFAIKTYRFITNRVLPVTLGSYNLKCLSAEAATRVLFKSEYEMSKNTLVLF